MSKQRGVKLAPSAAKKLFEAGRFVEQQPRNQARDPSPPVNFGGLTCLHVTTACNAMSGATPGQNGRGKIQKFNGTSYSDSSSIVYPIVNDTEKVIAVGAFVQCSPGAGGKLHVVVVDKCSNLS